MTDNNQCSVLSNKNVQIIRYLVVFLLFCYSGNLYSHAQLTLNSATPPRYDSPALKNKSYACGATGVNATSTKIKTILDVGSTITLTWKETVDHPGHFLFDFAAANDSFDLVQVVVDDPSNAGVSSLNPLVRSVDYTFPADTCENCTLRMRQTMFVPNPPEANYDPKTDTRPSPYFSCADIAIVDKSQTAMPSEVIGVTAANLTANSLDLSWTNPPVAEFSEIVVVRKVLANTTANFDTTLNNFTHYPKGINVNGDATLMVVYRGNSTTFNDTNLQSETSYGYEVFARNANYNYNLGSMQVFTTLADSGGGTGGNTGGGNTGGSGSTTPTSTGGDSGSGALSAMFLLLIGLFPLRRLNAQRNS